jgi:hypothetical protein
MTMRIAYFCFITGAAAALAGMSLGIAMGISHDFTLAPVHAHLNLLGWVSMLLYGFYYRGAPVQIGRLAWGQVIGAALGFPVMTGGLALLLSGSSGASLGEPLIGVGSLLTLGSMAAFMTILVRDAHRSRSIPTSSLPSQHTP